MKAATKESLKQKNIRRNKQLAGLLIKNPFFQRAIADWRKELDIPSAGFADEESCVAYFRRKEKEFEKKPLDKLLERGAKYEGRFGIFFRREVHRLMCCLNLLYNLEAVVTHYLLYNALPEDDGSYLRLPYCNEYPDENTGAYTKLAVIIDDATTIEEIKAIWPSVMETQREHKILMRVNQTKKITAENFLQVLDNYRRKPQFKELKKSERDELIIQLKKDGLSGKAIQKKIREMGYGVIGYEDVSKICARRNLRVGAGKA